MTLLHYSFVYYKSQSIIRSGQSFHIKYCATGGLFSDFRYQFKIKELGLAEIGEEELAHYFPEMRQYLGECKFHNCLHVNEPGCKVKEALDTGDITMERYASYLSMLEGEDNRR